LLEALTVGLGVVGELVEGLAVGLSVAGVFSLLGCGLVITGGLSAPFDKLAVFSLLQPEVVMVKPSTIKARPNLFNFKIYFLKKASIHGDQKGQLDKKSRPTEDKIDISNYKFREVSFYSFVEGDLTEFIPCEMTISHFLSVLRLNPSKMFVGGLFTGTTILSQIFFNSSSEMPLSGRLPTVYSIPFFIN